MSLRRIVTLTVAVGSGMALLTFPAALVLAIALEWWHTRNYDVADVFGED